MSSKRPNQRFDALPTCPSDESRNDCPPEEQVTSPRYPHQPQQQQQQLQHPQRSSVGDTDIVLVSSTGRMRGSNGLLYAGATGTSSVPGSGRREKSTRTPSGSKPSHRHSSHHTKNSSMLPPPPDPPVLDTSDISTSSDSIGNGGYSSFLGSTNNGHYQRVPQPCPDPEPVGRGDITGSPEYLDSNDNQQFVDHTSSCSPANSDSWGDPSKILDSLQIDTAAGDDTASSTSESDVTQIWVPAANQVPGRNDSHNQLGNGSWSMELPHGILKHSSSGLMPNNESSPKNAASTGSTPTEIGNGSDVGSDNMTSVSATGIGSRSSLVKKKVVHSLPKNNTVLRYDPSTGLTEALIVGSEDEDERRDVPNGDSGIGQDCEDDSTRHLAKFDSEPSSPSYRRRPSRPPPTARELLFDSIMANLSGIYGLLLIVMGAVIPISEVFSKPHPFLFEGFYFYLFGVGILFLLYAYVYILHSRTLGGMTKFRKSDDNMHYRMRYRIISDTGSFCLRLGAVGFGIGSMIKSGLQFGEFFELDFRSPCTNILQRLLPILHLTFTFAQLYFVFLNSKMCIQSYKAIARFGLMHMVGTNLSVWCRELVRETVREINEHVSLSKGAAHTMPEAEPLIMAAGSGNGSEYSFSQDNGDLNVLVSSIGGINTSVHSGPGIINDPQCLETSLMSKVVEDAAPYLYPCSIQYSLICAGILYTMWSNIGKRLLYQSSDEESQREAKVRSQKLSVDCSSSSRGLFMGIFLLVSAVVSMMVFFMLINNPSYMDAAIQLEHLSQVVLNVVAAIALILAFIRMRELRFTAKENLSLEEILLIISLPGEYIFGFLSIIAVGVEGIDRSGLIIMLSSVLAVFESSLQTMFILNGMRRSAHTPQLQKRKTGREFITFLMVCNIAMWGVNTFEIHRSEFNPAQMRFYGVLAWNIFTHVAVPLIIFFRFHSTVCLSNIWKHAWKRKSNSQESLTNAAQ